jgi:hypothetical protein
MHTVKTTMLLTAFATLLMAPEPASAQVSSSGSCRRLLDTDPATPAQSAETCFLDALSGVDQNGNVVSYQAVARAQLIETADSPQGFYDVIVSISATGFVPIVERFGEVVVSGSDGAPCVLETGVPDFQEKTCFQIFSFDGVFTADMSIDTFLFPD